MNSQPVRAAQSCRPRSVVPRYVVIERVADESGDVVFGVSIAEADGQSIGYDVATDYAQAIRLAESLRSEFRIVEPVHDEVVP